MVKVKVLLNSIDHVRDFVNIVSKYEADMDLVHGRYIINAKSMMGIFSIDLSQPVELHIYKDEGEAREILDELKGYLV